MFEKGVDPEGTLKQGKWRVQLQVSAEKAAAMSAASEDTLAQARHQSRLIDKLGEVALRAQPSSSAQFMKA